MGHEARRNALAAAAGAVALVTAAPVGAVSTAASAPAATPKTLVSVRGSIGGFAQDGNRVVWLWSGGRRCRDFVQLRNLRTRKQVPLAAKRGATCPPADGFIAGSLALAKDRELWAVYSATGEIRSSITRFTSSPATPGPGTASSTASAKKSRRTTAGMLP